MYQKKTLVRTWTGILLSLIALYCAPDLYADYIEPGDIKVVTKRYKPGYVEFARGTYTYDVSWQGIPVATAHVSVSDRTISEQPYLRVTAQAKTAKVIDLFYKLRFKSESIFSATSLKPVHFYSHQKENSKEKFRQVVFKPSGTIKTVYKKNGELRDTKEFKTENMTLDPISAAFVARSLPLRVGLERSFDVFNGKHRYLITFNVIAREHISVGGKERDSFRIVPTVEKLTDTKGEKRLKHATLWISAGKDRDVLKLESKVLVGRVNVKLARFTPAPRIPQQQMIEQPTVIAARGNSSVRN